MIKIENIEVSGWDAAIRGMRNPMNSWDKSDSHWTHIEDAETLETAKFQFFAGDNDLDLMKRLAQGGSVHAKYRRMIVVTCDITAPLYWWKEFDTYKVGTVANSCSTMHKIHDKPFDVDDFSREHLSAKSENLLRCIIKHLNEYREGFIQSKDKREWWQMIQLLPTSYNQKRTVQISYEVAAALCKDRRYHKLDEWHVLCDMLEGLPYADGIIYNIGG